MMKPTLFIGSSTESIRIAQAAQAELSHDVDATIWNQGLFSLSRATLDQLLVAAQQFDYALFVFSPDDIVQLRNQTFFAARDNVMFELGMFFGSLGQDRCFFLIPSNVADFRIPTDLAGITPGRYDPTSHKGNLQAALGAACTQVRTAITSSKGHLSGKWASVMLKDGVKLSRDREILDMELLDTGNRIAGTFTWKGRTYRVDGRRHTHQYMTGTYQDVIPGYRFHGAFQLCVYPGDEMMDGRWVGFNTNHELLGGQWQWRRPTKEKYPFEIETGISS